MVEWFGEVPSAWRRTVLGFSISLAIAFAFTLHPTLSGTPSAAGVARAANAIAVAYAAEPALVLLLTGILTGEANLGLDSALTELPFVATFVGVSVLVGTVDGPALPMFVFFSSVALAGLATSIDRHLDEDYRATNYAAVGLLSALVVLSTAGSLYGGGFGLEFVGGVLAGEALVVGTFALRIR